MDSKDLFALFTYAANCRQQLRETLLAHPDAVDRPFETLAIHSSIRRLIIHIIAAEERWIETRIRGRAIERYEAHQPENIPELFNDWERVRANTLAFLQELNPAGLRQSYLISLPHLKYEEHLTVEQILFHIINHETHHRAQISMALQQMQIDPPNFDYILLHG